MAVATARHVSGAGGFPPYVTPAWTSRQPLADVPHQTVSQRAVNRLPRVEQRPLFEPLLGLDSNAGTRRGVRRQREDSSSPDGRQLLRRDAGTTAHIPRTPTEGSRPASQHPSGVGIVFDTSTLLELIRNGTDDLDALLQRNRLILPFTSVHELDVLKKSRNRRNREKRRRSIELHRWLLAVLERPEEGRKHLRMQQRGDIAPAHAVQTRNNDDQIIGCAVFFKNKYRGKLSVLLATEDNNMAIKGIAEGLQRVKAADLVR